MTPFVIFALPRSRTAWLSKYLSYGGALVWHDTAIYCEKPGDFAANFTQGMTGCVETGAIIGWRAIRAMLPAARFMAITRPVGEIRNSLARHGWTPVDGELEHRRTVLDAMVETEGCPVFSFADMERREIREEIFRYCLQRPFDAEWDERMNALNIQINMQQRFNTLIANRDKIEALKVAMNAE